MAKGRVGQYEIVREVARGGFAVVYLATQLGLDREVALKELSALQATDRSVVERFLRESRMAGSLNHPNIVTVHEYFEHEGTPYISMEYLERGALRPLLDQLTLPQIFGVLEGVLAGLAHAEKKQIIHRDLKPENLMVTSEGGIKIADFGIAKAVGHVTSQLTATGMTIGTPVYMAPEQAMAIPIGPWTDLYSLGVIAYELTLGRVPFEDMEFPVAVLYRHIHDPIPPPLWIKPDLDPGLAAWIERLLAKDPKDRYQRAVDAWEDLEEVVLEVLGPRWRRGARLVEVMQGAEPESINKSLSPAPFHLGSSPPNELRIPAEIESGEADAVNEGDAVATPALYVAEDKGSSGVGTQDPASVSEQAQSEVIAEKDGVGSIEDLPTMPPTRRPDKVSEKSEPVGKKRRLRVPVAVWIAIAALLAVGGVGLTSFMGKAEDDKAGKSVDGTAPYALIPSERISVAVSDSLYLSHPDGRIVRLDRSTLEPLATLRHPPGPQSLAVGPHNFYVADNQALTEFRKDGLVPQAATRLGEEVVFLAGLEGGGPLVSAAVAGPDKGTVCEYIQTLLSPIVTPAGNPLMGFDLLQDGRLKKSCLDLEFVPSGIGTSKGETYVADDRDGTVVAITGSGDGLAVGSRIKAGRNPHGPVIGFADHLYVSVKSGIAVLDVVAKKLDRTLKLPATPSAIWVIPSIGRVAAALPDRGEVVIFNTTSQNEEPVSVKLGGRPVALGGPLTDGAESGFLYVATAEDGKIHRLNPLTGELAGSKKVPGIGEGPIDPIVVRDGAFAEANGILSLHLNFETGAVDPPGIVVTDGDISDGKASLEIRQGAISSKIDKYTDKGATVEVAGGPSHLVVTLSTESPRVGEVAAHPAPDGRSLVIDLGKIEPVVQAPRPRTTRAAPAPRPTRIVSKKPPTPAPTRSTVTSRPPTPTPSAAPQPQPQPPAPPPSSFIPLPTPS